MRKRKAFGKHAAKLRAMAEEIATTWLVHHWTGRGLDIYSPRLVEARSLDEALEQVPGAKNARPVLPTRKWDELKRQLQKN